MACSGCKGAPVLEGDAPPVHYCNKTCQGADWPNHKPTCVRLRDRNILYRVESIAQKLWYLSREITWSTFQITWIDTNEDDMQLESMATGQPNVYREALNLHGHNLEENGTRDPTYPTVIPFPVDLLPHLQDQEAALSYLGGSQAAVWMIEFIGGMLEGIVKQTVSVEHRTKGELRRTRYAPHNPRSAATAFPMFLFAADLRKPVHTVLRVILLSGEKYAIDLAGAQVGHHAPVIPWSEFERARVLNTISVGAASQPKGLLPVNDFSDAARTILHQRMHQSNQSNQPKLIVEDILEETAMCIIEWQQRNIDLTTLWKLPSPQFAIRQGELVDYVNWRLSIPVYGGPGD